MKYIAPLLAVLAPVLAIFAPAIQAFVSAHPFVGIIAGALATLAAAFAPQPHK